MNPEINPRSNRAGYGGLAAIAALTFFVYLVFGLYYVTHNAERMQYNSADWRLRGDAYLTSFGTWNTDHEADEAYYNRTALAVLRTGVPRRADGSVTLHAPLYSYFLGLCYAVGGVCRISVALPHALALGLVAWWAGLAARRLAPQLGPKIMWLAAGLILADLRWGRSVAMISPTPLLLLWFSTALYAAAGPLRWPGALGLAGALALGVFTQATFFVVAAAVALWLGVLFVRRREVPLLFACALVLITIGINLSLPAIESKGEGSGGAKSMVLWEANNPYYESMRLTSLWGRRPGNPWSTWEASPQEQQRFDDYFRRAKDTGQNPGRLWIKENPMQYAKLCWIRLCAGVGPFTGQMSPRNRMISTYYWLLIFPAGIYGLWRKRHEPLSQLAALVFLALTAFGTLIIVEWYSRYRLPFELILSVYAAVTYAEMLRDRSTALARGSCVKEADKIAPVTTTQERG